MSFLTYFSAVKRCFFSDIFIFQKRNKLHSEEECRFIGHCCIGVYFDTNGDHADNHHTFTDWSSPDTSKRIHFAFLYQFTTSELLYKRGLWFASVI